MQEPGAKCDAAFLKKSRTVRSSRVPENFFVEVPGKFLGKLFLEKFEKGDHCLS
jgi:hypothetical protein